MLIEKHLILKSIWGKERFLNSGAGKTISIDADYSRIEVMARFQFVLSTNPIILEKL